jgi:hypothetical protein
MSFNWMHTWSIRGEKKRSIGYVGWLIRSKGGWCIAGFLDCVCFPPSLPTYHVYHRRRRYVFCSFLLPLYFPFVWIVFPLISQPKKESISFGKEGAEMIHNPPFLALFWFCPRKYMRSYLQVHNAWNTCDSVFLNDIISSPFYFLVHSLLRCTCRRDSKSYPSKC